MNVKMTPDEVFEALLNGTPEEREAAKEYMRADIRQNLRNRAAEAVRNGDNAGYRAYKKMVEDMSE